MATVEMQLSGAAARPECGSDPGVYSILPEIPCCGVPQ